MILSDRDIRRRLEDGSLVIDPLEDPELQIQPASVDLRLGREFLEFRQSNIPYINPESPAQVEDYVTRTVVDDGDETEQATLSAEDGGAYYDDGKFILHPRDFVLGTTLERVEIPPDLIAHVEGRSSLGRLAVVVHASLPYDEQLFLWTPEGGFGFHPIGEVVEEERPAHAVSFDPRTLRVGTYPVTDYIENPTRRLYRVTLESGREVLVTRDHNLFTVDGRGSVVRVPSEDAEGRLVMVPRTLPGPRGTETGIDVRELLDGDGGRVVASDGGEVAPAGTDRRDGSDLGVALDGAHAPRELAVTPTLGWLVGYFAATGSIEGSRLVVGGTDPERLDAVAGWFDRQGVEVRGPVDDGGIGRVTATSGPLARAFARLVDAGGDPTLPDRAWNWSDDVVEAVLEGLLDADGRMDEGGWTLDVDPRLADRVMYLATRLGRRCRYVDAEGRLRISPGAGGRTDDAVPAPTRYLRRLRRRADARDVEPPESLERRVESAAGATAVDRSTLRARRDRLAATGLDVTRLDHLLDGGVRFERVTAVERTDRVEPTYDLEVQPGGRAIENFLGGRGGIFLSNTAGLCDPGYRGQITLELSNLGTAPVALSPGMRVSQLTFTELSSPASRPYGPDRGSKYQDQEGPQASRIGHDDEFDDEGA